VLGLAYLMPGCWLEVSLHSEGPATGQLDQGFPWFSLVPEQMLSWYPNSTFTACFSCSSPNGNTKNFALMYTSWCRIDNFRMEHWLAVGRNVTLTFDFDIDQVGGGLEYLHRSYASCKRRVLKDDVKLTQCPGYNWATLFLGDINTGTWPSRLGESQMRQ
jgi:hypothetical protein